MVVVVNRIFKRRPFAFQKAAFRSVKGGLSGGKTRPFAEPLTVRQLRGGCFFMGRIGLIGLMGRMRPCRRGPARHSFLLLLSLLLHSFHIPPLLLLSLLLYSFSPYSFTPFIFLLYSFSPYSFTPFTFLLYSSRLRTPPRTCRRPSPCRCQRRRLRSPR